MILIFLLLVILLVVGGWLHQRRRTQKHRRLIMQQLRGWLSADETRDPQLQRWVNGLSTDEADVLLALVNGYFASLNWELRWLFSPQLQKTPLLQQAVEAAVLAYMRSILASLQLIDEVRAYNTYVDLLCKPNGRRQFSLIKKLYGALVAQEIVEPTVKKRRILGSKAARKEQIAVVLGAFEREPAMAMATLKVLLAIEATADVQEMMDLAPSAAVTAPFTAAA